MKWKAFFIILKGLHVADAEFFFEHASPALTRALLFKTDQVLGFLSNKSEFSKFISLEDPWLTTFLFYENAQLPTYVTLVLDFPLYLSINA